MSYNRQKDFLKDKFRYRVVELIEESNSNVINLIISTFLCKLGITMNKYNQKVTNNRNYSWIFDYSVLL